LLSAFFFSGWKKISAGWKSAIQLAGNDFIIAPELALTSKKIPRCK